jgi:hypothetical protein|tara:strand:+ start:930 stop:1217 length:288 start_codon:yes stop_codon:yes gene_type:complete
MAIENKKLNVDIDGDGKTDLNIDLKTIILVVGGIISLTMTYSTLTKEIELAKKLPPVESHDIINQKILYLEDYVEKLEDQLDNRINNLEIKVYKR